MSRIVISKSYLYSRMVQSLMVCLCIAVIFLSVLVVVITTETDRNGLAIISSTLAQTTPTSSGNMTAPMMESASFHLKEADRLLMEGNTDAALDQINLAEIQLSLLGMNSGETSMNQAQQWSLPLEVPYQV